MKISAKVIITTKQQNIYLYINDDDLQNEWNDKWIEWNALMEL